MVRGIKSTTLIAGPKVPLAIRMRSILTTFTRTEFS
jgi:hypothetical protein